MQLTALIFDHKGQTCPTYTSCLSSCFAHWRKAHSERRVVPGCEQPSPPLWTCCGCPCWGCWHSVGLAGPLCCDLPPHGGPYTRAIPASWLWGSCPNCGQMRLIKTRHKLAEDGKPVALLSCVTRFGPSEATTVRHARLPLLEKSLLSR